MAVKSAKIGEPDRQDGHFGINLAASGSIWGAFWSHLGKQAENQKTLKTKFFRDSGGPGEQFWINLALCWAMLDHLGAILEQLGDKVAAKSANMSQHGAQERQHEPT